MQTNKPVVKYTTSNKNQTQRKKCNVQSRSNTKTAKESVEVVKRDKCLLSKKQMKKNGSVLISTKPEMAGINENSLLGIVTLEKYEQVLQEQEVGIQISRFNNKAEKDAQCQELMRRKEDKPVLKNATENVQIKQDTFTSKISLKDAYEAVPSLGSELQSLLIRLAVTCPDHNAEEENSEDTRSISNPEINSNKPVLGTKSVTLQEMDFLKIKSINHYSSRDCYLMRKYVNKWKQNINNKKKASVDERQLVLNAFFNKLENKKNGVHSQTDFSNKAKLSAKDYNNYQHRYKMQKHIIALQKAKLEEQTRLIDELKYNKIVEASKNSVETMRDELRKTYFEIDRHLKPKIKCLTNELKIPEIEEQSLVLQCLKMPQFLQRMEKRAREREEKHALIRERRKQMEEERVRLKQQAELAKSEMDKEERMKIIKELKEKRKREKVEQIRKKQHAERMRALRVMADLHYERNLLARCGLQPLKRLLELKRDNVEKAKAHHRFQLLKNKFLKWMFYTEDMWIERNYKAEDFYRKKLLRRVFEAFKTNHHELVLKKQVADDYYDLYVVQLAFRKFRLGVERIKHEQAVKWDRAVTYHNGNLKFKIFTCWRSLPALNALLREQEARKARWRQKVLQVVPDYQPPED